MRVTVNTQSGAVRGSEADGVHAFKGVPFAASPYGDNRLQPPQPVEPWSGVRDALTYGPKSPQPEYPPEVELVLPELTGPGEDCLTLNIWTPDPDSTGLPVMVWIPGGVYEFHGTGASPWYDGSRFARDGVVCVTISYRVGADGFLYLGDDIANLGLLDQIAALEWVRENIAAFGGDPGNVTIFGESAGAMSVGTLLAVPRAEGLFQHAIAQSGAAHHVLSPETGQRIGQLLAEKLGVEASREAIADVPVERVIDAQNELRADLQSNPDPERWGGEVVSTFMPWQPVIDGDLLPAHPLERIESGDSVDVDLLVGTNIDEHRLFLVTGGVIDQVTEEALAGTVAGYGLPVEETIEAYRNLHPGGSSGDLLAAIQTDWFWRIPAVRLADAHAKNSADTYMYEFAWKSPQFDGRLGACHALEIPFVFDTLDNQTEALWGTTPPHTLADTMHEAWVDFATSGDCDWPPYDPGRRATMRFDTTTTVVDDPLSGERAIWEDVR
ncbi:carboxylesterase/lipase family protein [Haloferax sp. DFSO52]|uniref:carboxylesterase/lipase family protein n=1 Tax=Haloferax sp. DFSO52 TaxID=3388505 RepID=UPI003A890FEA